MTAANPPELPDTKRTARADLENTKIRDSVQSDVMLHNAARFFGMEKDENGR